MSLPKPLTVQSIGGLRHDPMNYESHRQTITAHNELIAALGPGTAIRPANIALSTTLGSNSRVTDVGGTFKRGRFTITIAGTGTAPNPTITLGFPKDLFTDTPFAQIVRNGGTGTLGYSYTEATTGITITLNGTPTPGDTYTFQFAVRD